METHTFETESQQETEAAGERLAVDMEPGRLVLLHGELGAGKTAFVRGMARGLGVSADEVSSPTFTLIQPYQAARTVLFHVDLYRLTPVEVEDLGLDELLAEGGILAVEWPDRWRDRPTAMYDVVLAHLGGDRRSITVTAASGAPRAGA